MYRKAQNRFLALAMVFILLFSFYSCLAEEKVEVPKEIMQKIEKIVDGQSCFAGVDGLERKDRNNRIKDMIKWYSQYGKVCEYYNDWGLDIKNFRNQDDFLDQTAIFSERRQLFGNNINPNDSMYYADKFSFYKKMQKSRLLNKTPKVHYIVEQGEVVFPKNNLNLNTSEVFKSLKNGKYICKPQDGIAGIGIYLIEKNDDNIFAYERDSHKIDFNKFLENIHSGRYIIQEYINQHEKLKKLHPSSLNTVRVVTMRYNNKTQILAAFLRMGTEKFFIDNVSAGGTCVAINLENGTLQKYGCYHGHFHKKIELEHPVSYIKYEGYQLPFWKEVVTLAEEVHDVFSGLSSVGEDIAITPEGPIIVEINPCYAVLGLQACNGGLKQKWNKLKNI